VEVILLEPLQITKTMKKTKKFPLILYLNNFCMVMETLEVTIIKHLAIWTDRLLLHPEIIIKFYMKLISYLINQITLIVMMVTMMTYNYLKSFKETLIILIVQNHFAID